MNDALAQAVAVLGSQSAVARAVGVSPQAVQQYLKEGVPVPAPWCVPIQRATRGQVTCRMLRPDLYPDDASGSSSPPADCAAE